MPDPISRREFLLRTAAGLSLSRPRTRGEISVTAYQPAGDPDWRRTHLRRACLAGPSREEIEAMAQVGANVIQCNLNAWVTEQREGPGILGGNPAGDFVELTHRLGAKAVGYLNTRLNPLLQERPDWITRDHQGRSISGDQTPSACQNSPYGDFLIERMAEFSRRFPLDGWWLDCWTGPYQNCWCGFCRERFQAETGLPMPAAPDPADPGYGPYLEWRDRAAERFFARLHEAVGAARPGTHVWVNFAADPRNAPLPFSDDVFRMVEAPTAEGWLAFHLDNALATPFSLARLQGSAGGRETEVWMVPSGLQWDRTTTPDVEMMARVYTVLTYGSVLQFPTAPGHNEQMRTAFDAIRAREPWLTGVEPLPWAALVLSWRTPEFYGRGEAVARYYQEAMGIFRALSEEHLPLRIVTERDMEEGRLAGCPLAILPNAACLTDAALEALRGYVEEGGGLVVTHEASLCDRYGRPRDDFALADLLGVRLVGRESFEGWQSDRLWLDDHPTARDEIIDDSRWDCITSTPREWLGSVDWVGRALQVESSADVEIPARRNGDGNREPTWPALALSRRGRGRVAFFPLELGAAYYHTGYPYLRRWLYRTLLWTAGSQPPVEVSGPLCLLATVWRQEGGRILVHLLNDNSSAGRRPRDARYLPLREEVLPLHDLRVICRLPGVTRATLQPQGLELALERTADGVAAVVPRLEQHAVVVLEG